MKKYILALDQGTTSSRSIIYDRKGNTVSVAQMEFRQYYPHEGWVEHDPNEIWTTQMTVAHEALLKAGLTWENIEAVGITNQRETAVVWDKISGEPVCRAIVWQCRRTAGYCDELAEDKALVERIRSRTGLLLDAYFSATKLRWVLENVSGARERAEAGELLFGTVETWLIWKMTGGKVHVTDYSNASRTMLFNIHDLCWDEEILKILDIPKCMLPEPVPSSCVYGETMPELFGGPVPIAGAAGDQQAALFGQTCFSPGEAKSTYGTGNFLLMNTGKTPVKSGNGLLTTIAWGLDAGGPVEYALEGSVFVCGAAIQWLRDELDILDDAAESERMALSVPDSAGIYVVPAFVGLGAPYWDPYARGSIFGITRGAGKNHLVRATLESMAFQCYDLLGAMSRDMGEKLPALKVDGGACANNYLMQFQADILGCEVLRPACIETTSLGAAYLAGLATGYWQDQKDIRNNWQVDRVFAPQMSASDREAKLAGWQEAVKRSRDWIRP
ncbi:glycerol kinase GlpK [Hornefia butyriciproducens]|uniref:glycerol kinase GlpK n=1 Tax=Hornefia butyriciproducens TaxID=2652293 RepID=UPI002A9130B6|nr:glycerol kinase GlpK [Hornefia butyriciproducens]MDY5424218.1 glycerol kinase GlpK [Hornefia butyriciproducens]